MIIHQELKKSMKYSVRHLFYQGSILTKVSIYNKLHFWNVFEFTYYFAGTNLFNTVTHEIGHTLGLEHSNDRDAVMYPYIKPYDPGFQLGRDDIQRIIDLYGE